MSNFRVGQILLFVAVQKVVMLIFGKQVGNVVPPSPVPSKQKVHLKGKLVKTSGAAAVLHPLLL